MNDVEENDDYLSEVAKAAGRQEALSAIWGQGMAVRDAAYDMPATATAWKARAALQIWRAAYAAANREMLAIQDQLQGYAQGAGIPDTIFEHPEEHKQQIESEAATAAWMKAAESREGANDNDEAGHERNDDALPF